MEIEPRAKQRDEKRSIAHQPASAAASLAEKGSCGPAENRAWGRYFGAVVDPLASIAAATR